MISSPLIFFLLPQSNEIPPQKMVNSTHPILLRVYCSLNKKPLRWRYHFAVVKYIKLTGKKFDDGSPILFICLT